MNNSPPPLSPGKYKGRFITLEGGEGAGKTTQRTLLVKALETCFLDNAHPLEVVSTREPGGSVGAESIRDLLVNGETGRWDTCCETLLHFTARRDHLQKTVLPALKRGAWVICDRFTDSTYAYQGYGRGMDLGVLGTLNDICCDGFTPDLTLLLDISVHEGLRRAASRKTDSVTHPDEDRYEKMGPGFHERVRQGFLTLAQENPHRFRMEQATLPPQELSKRLLDHIIAAFPELSKDTRCE